MCAVKRHIRTIGLRVRKLDKVQWHHQIRSL